MDLPRFFDAPLRAVLRGALVRASLFALAVAPTVACGAADASSDDDLGAADEELSGDPAAIDIGINGNAEQFGYYDQFLAISAGKKGPRICHMYPSWDVALQPPGHGDVNLPGSRAYLENWFARAEGHCDQALISFKSYPRSRGGSGNEGTTRPPSVHDFAHAFDAFRVTHWWNGTFAFTAWNEPNNGASTGDGLGAPLPAELAAEYYLTIRSVCHDASCTVAAGDFASNGGMVHDFKDNCGNDNVAPGALCKQASYLDRYKNFIANHANDRAYRLGENFRPEVFAFHPWYDVNAYLDSQKHCQSEDDCSTRALLHNLRGSWGRAELWDTEIGVGQDGQAALSDDAQACGAAFLMRLSSRLSRRVTRVYYTHLHGGNPSLFVNGQPRPAMSVLARRESTSPFGQCP